MKERCLITGFAGSIGVHMMAHIFQNTNWDVIGVDSLMHKGDIRRIEKACKDYPEWSKRLTVIVHDLTSPFSKFHLRKIGKVDYIINLASLADVWDSIADPVPFIRNNVELMLTMLEFARVVKPKAFVQFSTDEVYGPVEGDTTHKEWETLLPSNPYAASKAAQEVLAVSYWRSYGVPLIITNATNNFGAMQGVSKYPTMIQSKLVKGEKITVHATEDGEMGTRYYIHSRNTADAVLFLLKKTKPYLHEFGKIDRPDKYNIVGDKEVDNLEMAKIIAKLMGKELNYELTYLHAQHPGHDLHYGLEGTKLAKLGWKSPVSFEKSLKDTIDWQARNPEWME